MTTDEAPTTAAPSARDFYERQQRRRRAEQFRLTARPTPQADIVEALPSPPDIIPPPLTEQAVTPEPVPAVVPDPPVPDPPVVPDPVAAVHIGSSPPRVRLVVQSGLEDGTAFDLPIGEWAVGRLPGSMVYLQDESVSRRHALLTVDTNGITVTDDRSTNGTSVNGGLITRPTRVETGDTVTFGGVEMLVARISPPPLHQADEQDPQSPHHHHWPFQHDDATEPGGGEGPAPAP